MSDPTSIGSKLYTFITTTPDEPTGAGTRGIINSHVAKISHLRRQKRVSGEPRILSYSLRELWDIQPNDSVLPYCLICSKNGHETWTPGPCPHILERVLERRSVVNSQKGSVLAHGNSDPFDSCK
jgi:hypothetical protein